MFLHLFDLKIKWNEKFKKNNIKIEEKSLVKMPKKSFEGVYK